MKDLIGLKFGKRIVIKFSHTNKYGFKYWLCECACKTQSTVRSDQILHGKASQCRKCSNIEKDTIHNLSYHPIYILWNSIKARCYYKKYQYYKNYGARGIKVCDEWLYNPKEFIEWALNNGYQQGLQIDRIDNNGNYEPNNCRFVTNAINCQNRNNTKLNINNIKDIRFAYNSGINITNLSKIYNVSWSMIKKIITYKSWNNIGI